MRYTQQKSAEHDPEQKVLNVCCFSNKSPTVLSRCTVRTGTRGRRWNALDMGIGVGSISRSVFQHLNALQIVIPVLQLLSLTFAGYLKLLFA